MVKPERALRCKMLLKFKAGKVLRYPGDAAAPRRPRQVFLPDQLVATQFVSIGCRGMLSSGKRASGPNSIPGKPITWDWYRR